MASLPHLTTIYSSNCTSHLNSRQINSEQSLIDSELATVQADLDHNYRTQAQLLMQREIPKQQATLNQLEQQRNQIHPVALSPSLSLLKMFSESFSVPFDYLENIFVAMIAILIELISTYLMLISMVSKQPPEKVYSLDSEMFSKSPEISHEASIVKAYMEVKPKIENIAQKISETSNNISEGSKNLLEKYENVLKSIENKMYDAQITKIMKYEKIGYSLAKQILCMLHERNPQKFLK
ncbi:MAG: hypothetical protein HKM04_06200 [Legionellales bacterium]|nr:hypothetical protein [Legionellales bacterium]